MSAKYEQIWMDYFRLTGALVMYERESGRRDPGVYEALARLRDAAFAGEAVPSNIGTAA